MVVNNFGSIRNVLHLPHVARAPRRKPATRFFAWQCGQTKIGIFHPPMVSSCDWFQLISQIAYVDEQPASRGGRGVAGVGGLGTSDGNPCMRRFSVSSMTLRACSGVSAIAFPTGESDSY